MGKKQRDSITARVWRKMPEETMTTTLEGGRTLKLYWCKTCKQYKSENDFYVESPSKATAMKKVRSQCILCWDLYEGKLYKPDTGAASLFDFLK